jgi:Zn-dependent M28 family amino/carboxypeptidase
VDLFPHGRKAWLRFAGTWVVVALFVAGLAAFMTSMPGESHDGPLLPLSPQEAETSINLRNHVASLAGRIGERNLTAYNQLQATAAYIEDALKSEGYRVDSQEYVTENRKVRNLIAEIPGAGRAGEIVIVGAHYDTAYDCPGADDNTSGVAALLELARLLHGTHPARTIRFVAFVNEEPPWFQTEAMGSWVYAKHLHKLNENIVAALSIETVGMYSDSPDSQHYPAGFAALYPSKGNFIGFIGNLSSRTLVREAVASFRKAARFPSEGAAVPAWIQGVGWSDHWSFWKEGYPAIMVTDTAPFRNPNYHQPSDKPGTLDYDRMARVVHGLAAVVHDLGK